VLAKQAAQAKGRIHVGVLNHLTHLLYQRSDLEQSVHKAECCGRCAASIWDKGLCGEMSTLANKGTHTNIVNLRFDLVNNLLVARHLAAKEAISNDRQASTTAYTRS
jgi:hypothetical protein